MLSKIPGSRDRSGRCSLGRWPVNGYVASLLVQLGDYATAGKSLISLVDAHSIWVDGYSDESNLTAIHQVDLATIN
jgi:multidrug resistance efflux pump